MPFDRKVLFCAGVLALAMSSPGLVQAMPAKAEQPSPPTIDTNGDGAPDAWDRDGDGKPDAWDSNADGKPDKFDNDNDGKPDEAPPPR
jgi:hypothetical protein